MRKGKRQKAGGRSWLLRRQISKSFKIMFPSNCCHRQHVAKIPLNFWVFLNHRILVSQYASFLIQCFNKTETWGGCEHRLESNVKIILSPGFTPRRSTRWWSSSEAKSQILHVDHPPTEMSQELFWSVYIKEEISSWKRLKRR